MVEMNLTLDEIKSLAEYVGFVIDMDKSKERIPDLDVTKDSNKDGVVIFQKEGKKEFRFEIEGGKADIFGFTCVRNTDSAENECEELLAAKRIDN